MSRVNLSAALRFLKTLGDSDLDTATFEKECGVGVVVSQDEVKTALQQVCNDNAEIFNAGWTSQGKLMPIIKKNEKLTWADG
jgi:glutaminyl-tRNA synthetase